MITMIWYVIPTYDLVIHHSYDDTEDGNEDSKDDNDKSWYDYLIPNYVDYSSIEV